MRQRKFRAWHNEKKIMAQVSTLHYNGDIRASWIDKDLYEKEKNSSLFYPGAVSEDWNISQYEIMDFTGLQDQDGKDIFEGDILQFETDKKFGFQENGKKLTFSIEFGKFNARNDTLYAFIGFHTNESSIQYMLSYGCTIVGNIYETSNLKQ